MTDNIIFSPAIAITLNELRHEAEDDSTALEENEIIAVKRNDVTIDNAPELDEV